jgi:hypothetical protein
LVQLNLFHPGWSVLGKVFISKLTAVGARWTVSMFHVTHSVLPSWVTQHVLLSCVTVLIFL